MVAFISSFFLASYLSDNHLRLTSQFDNTAHWLRSIFSDEVKIKNLIEDPLLADNKATNKAHTNVNQQAEFNYQYICKDTSLGKLSYKKMGNVYSWTDEEGIAHFSDNPPKFGNFTSLTFAGDKVFDFFSLTLNTENLAYDFNQKLKVNLNKLFALYGDLLPVTSLKKVNIDIRVYSSLTDFNQLKAKHNVSLSDNTLGFYSHANNQAHLFFTNNQETLKVATHEATHAINRGVIGYTPRWFNEGIAEVSESIEVQAKIGRLFSSKYWTKDHYFSEKKLPLAVIFSATANEWNGLLKTRLYATSWAFVYFMLEHPQRKAMLAKLIQYEQQNLCDEIEPKDIEQVLGIPISTLQTQFTRWLNKEIKSQRI